MNTETTIKCSRLDRKMPDALPSKTTVREHFDAFYLFSGADVWTADGWLVTAVQNDGVTHHLRRDDELTVRTMQPDDVLHFAPTAQLRHWGIA